MFGDLFYSTPEAARLYRIPARTLRRWIAQADIAHHGHAVRPRYRLADLNDVAIQHGAVQEAA